MADDAADVGKWNAIYCIFYVYIYVEYDTFKW